MNGVCTLLFALACFSVARATTYVANAFRSPIFVMVDADKKKLVKAGGQLSVNFAGIGIGAGGGAVWQTTYTAKSSGFTAIDCQKYLPFEPDTSGHVYISIFTYVNDKKQQITEAYPFVNNRAVLVDENAFMNVAQSNDPWVDSEGKNHKKTATKAVTTVANAYPYPIHVMVDAAEAKLRFVSRELAENSISSEGREDGFTIINSQEPHAFERQHYGTVYISIVSFKEGKKAIITNAHSIRPGRGLIVNENGSITLAREGAVWIDAQGFDHRVTKPFANIVKGTTIANAYPYPIHVIVTDDVMMHFDESDKLQAYAMSVGEGVQSDKYHIWNPLGYKSIDYQEAHTFETKLDGKVFISAFAFVNGKMEAKLHGYPNTAGRGVIIGEEGALNFAQAGSTWVDENNHNHRVIQTPIYM